MIIVDFNQIMISNIFAQIGSHTNAQIEENLVRHMVLNTIRSIRIKFIGYGEMVIATDSRKYWRKDVFQYYKANRKKDRDASDIDWPAIFDCLAKLKAELTEFFPYRVLDIDKAEADDIIGTLCFEHGTVLAGEDKIVISSGDKDFVQLQQFANIEQYDPVGKKYLKTNNSANFLMEHIIRGDRGDGIPNILSDDDTLVTEGKRQKKITQKYLDEFPNRFAKGELTETEKRNWKRNEQLIDLTKIPNDIREAILKEFDRQAGKSRDKLFNYFIHFKLKTLMENIGDY